MIADDDHGLTEGFRPGLFGHIAAPGTEGQHHQHTQNAPEQIPKGLMEHHGKSFHHSLLMPDTA